MVARARAPLRPRRATPPPVGGLPAVDSELAAARAELTAAQQWPGNNTDALLAAAQARLSAAQAPAQAAKPVSARLKSTQDRMEGLLAKATALRTERDELLSQVARLDTEIADADAMARDCSVELERLHREAIPAQPLSVEALLRTILEGGHAHEAIATLSLALAAGASSPAQGPAVAPAGAPAPAPPPAGAGVGGLEDVGPNAHMADPELEQAYRELVADPPAAVGVRRRDAADDLPASIRRRVGPAQGKGSGEGRLSPSSPRATPWR